MKVLLGQILGAWLAFATIALFLRTFAKPKDTAITCAWCGHPIPMDTALEGGIGAVNAAMREHMLECEAHPLGQAKVELADARAAMKSIYALCGDVTRLHPDSPLEVRRKVDKISDIAARLH